MALLSRGGNRSIYCANGSSPTLRNCVFRDNAYYGIRTYNDSSPLLENCLITGNASYGAYLDGGAAQLSGCRIQDNGSCGVTGSSYSGTVSNCVVSENAAAGMSLSGTSRVINCTVVGNSGGISGTFNEITNCIVWGNGDDLIGCSATHSCIEDFDTGTGNIHANPLFLDTDSNDYHLWYSSYCIDAGDPCSVYANEPNDGGGRVNMGAYGNTAEARTIVDADGDGLDDTWEQLYWPGDDPNLHDPNDDPDNDGLRNKDEYYVRWDPNSDDSGSIIGFVYNTRVDVNYPSISLAVSMVLEDDVLVLEPHTYHERFSFPGVPVHIRSADPNDPNVVATTIIDPDDPAVSVVGFGLGQDANSILDGVTVTGGNRSVYCINGSFPTLRNCVFRDNAYYGIRANNSFPLLENCQITGNASYGAYLDGGAAELSGCRIQDNGSYGVYARSSYSGTISNCVISGNSSYGVRSASASGVEVINCTVFGNSGGISGTFDVITNCIVWGNGDDLISCTATFSCIEDSDAGIGNTHANPLFLDAPSDDFHLDPNSPCVDGGVPWHDYAQEPSPNGGRINMGAYGNTAEATATIDADGDGISDAWETLYWPSDDPNLHDPNEDPDGDGLTNLSEYLFGGNPNTTDPSATLAILHTVAPAADFDPTDAETVTVEYWINIDANAVTSFVDASDPNYTARAIVQAATVGRNLAIWNGQDANSEIVEAGFYDVALDVNDGVDTDNADFGTVELHYDHAVSNVRANPYRFIATYNEITTIWYDATVDADMVVNIYDPNGGLFRTISVPLADPNEVIWDGRNKDPEESDSRYIGIDGEYKIEVKYDGMGEKAEGKVHVYK